MSVTKNTGWKNPKTMTQYAKYNGQVCSAWSRIPTAKVDEPKSQKYYDLSAVCYNLTNTRSSALVYSYNYGFNIPSNATITKILIKTVSCGDDVTGSNVITSLTRLKIGASVTDSGAGNNIAPSNIKWRTHASAHRNGMHYITVGDGNAKTVYGLNLTPAMVNNKDFGFVFQCKCDGSQQHKAYLDSVQMYIEYTVNEDVPIVKPTVTLTLDEEPTPPKVEVTVVDRATVTETKDTITPIISAVKYNTLTPTLYLDQTVISQPYDYTGSFHFWIKYKNSVQTKNNTPVIITQKSNKLILETDGKTIFSGNKTSKNIPSIQIMGTNDSRYFKDDAHPLAPNYIEQFYDIFVYSNIDDYYLYDNSKGYIESTVTLYSTKTVDGKTVKDKKIDSITFKLNNTHSNIANSQTILTNCYFANNLANKGAAIYNLGRLYVKNLTFVDNHTSGDDRNYCAFTDVDICRDKEFE